MTEYTGVDLSKLPAPTIVEPADFETVLAELLADFQARMPGFDALVESDPAFKLCEAFAYREVRLREQFNDRARQAMLAFATASNLDHLGALLGVSRLVLDPGDADEGIPPTFEGDGDFRRRIQLAPEGFSVAGPVGAYIFHGLRAHADVADIAVSEPSPGVVDVTVLSRIGDGTPSAECLAAVDAALSADTVRPLGDDVNVQAATVVAYTIDATVYTYPGPDSAVVMAAAAAQLDALLAARRLGRDVTLSAIYAALHVDGVQRVDLALPAADIAIGSDEYAHAATVLVVYGGVGG